MGEAVSQAGKKLLAVGVLLIAAFVLFKVVLGFLAGIVWIAIIVAALLAIVWALRVL
jgi:hypothetical protein